MCIRVYSYTYLVSTLSYEYTLIVHIDLYIVADSYWRDHITGWHTAYWEVACSLAQFSGSNMHMAGWHLHTVGWHTAYWEVACSLDKVSYSCCIVLWT